MSKQGTIGIEICLDKRTNCWYQSTFKYLSKPFLKRETVSIVCITEADGKNSIRALNLKKRFRHKDFDQYFSKEEFNFQRLTVKQLERNRQIKNGKLV